MDMMKILDFLYKELKRTKIDLAHAENRGAREDERDNLKEKIAILEYLIDMALKEV